LKPIIDIAVFEDLINSLSGMNSGSIPVPEIDEEHFEIFDDEVAKLVAHDLLGQLGK